MNIFAIEGKGNNIDWVKSAQSLDNYRVVKMILESCQMLCTAINHQHGAKETVLDLYDPSLFPSSDTTPLPLCMPEEYKSNNTVESYRRFYTDKPRMRYPTSKIPKWFVEYRTTEFQQIE